MAAAGSLRGVSPAHPPVCDRPPRSLGAQAAAQLVAAFDGIVGTVLLSTSSAGAVVIVVALVIPARVHQAAVGAAIAVAAATGGAIVGALARRYRDHRQAARRRALHGPGYGVRR